MIDVIRAKLKEIFKLRDTIKTDYLNYKSKRAKLLILVNIHYLLFFKRYI